MKAEKKMPSVIAVVMSDLHARQSNPVCRKDDYFIAMVRKLSFINTLCDEHMCMLVDAGDLFDTWKSTPKVEAALIRLLPKKFVSIAGNHEIPYHDSSKIDESSFNVVSASKDDGSFTHSRYFQEDNGCSVIGFDYCDGDLPSKDSIAAASINLGKRMNVAVWHGMVFKNEKINIDGVKGYTAAEVLDHFSDYDVVITGHNHETFTHKSGKKVLINPGSVMRSSIAQVDHKPCVFVLYDNGKFEKIFIPIDDDVFNTSIYEDAANRDKRIEAFIEQLHSPSGMTVDFVSNMNKFVRMNKIEKAVKQKIDDAMEGNNGK